MENETKKVEENVVKNDKKYQVSVYVNGEIYDLIVKMENEFPNMTHEFKKIMLSDYILFLKKQNDYGPNNIAMNTQLKTQEERKMSLIGLVTRMNDKMSRLVNLIFKNKKILNESIVDSFKDISVYGMISRIVINEKWGK